MKSKKPKLIVLTILILVVVTASILIFIKLRPDDDTANVQVVMDSISRHYLLPTGETPALATVTDSSKIQANFSSKLSNGDKILIYEKNKKAIVWRPSIDRIVDVQPVTVSDPSKSSETSSTTIPDIRPFGN